MEDLSKDFTSLDKYSGGYSEQSVDDPEYSNSSDDIMEDEFIFEPVNFNSVSVENGSGSTNYFSTGHGADEIACTRFIIKSEAEVTEMKDIKDENNSINNKVLDLKKVVKKVKQLRIKREYSEEDEKAVNSLIQIEEEGVYACMSPGCIKKWKSKSGMKVHIRTMHLNVISFDCEQCEYVSKHQHAMKAHILAIHENVYQKCEQCDYEAKYKTNILSHVKFAHRNAEKLQCNLCEYQAPKQYLLNYHIEGMHEKTVLHCDQCSFSTNWKNSLFKHMAYKHKQDKTHKCDSCVYSFALPFELRRHVYLQHGGGAALTFEKNTSGVYECDQCEYSAHKQRSMKIHFYNQHVE